LAHVAAGSISDMNSKRMPKYDFKKTEKKWQKDWLLKGVYEPDLKRSKKPFYNLMMFPYPSAEGLHIGGVRTFTGVDIYGRLKRMQGYDVFEPVGLDGFGINAENYALKIGRHPLKLSKETEKNFYRQLGMIGNGFSWNERLETYSPEYYKWTQWIFAQMFRWGLAYRKKQAVNWCPQDKTVLANEQVLSGKCERCGSTVEKKELEQWFFRITNYADRLDKNLAKMDWTESIKIAQKNWIGKSEGAEIDFQLKQSSWSVKVFTTRPDTLFGATYLVLAPEHPLLQSLRTRITNLAEVDAYLEKTSRKTEEERVEAKEKTGVELQGVKAVNPANREEIPVWVADYVLGGYGTGAIMAVPAHDTRDNEFAKKFGLPIRKVIVPVVGEMVRSAKDIAMGTEEELTVGSSIWTEGGKVVHSDKFTGMNSEEAKGAIVKFVSGKKKTQFRLRDWLLSRQRYWGAPIPMIHCAACEGAGKGERSDMPGWYAVPDKDLPVKLPNIKEFRPTGTDKSPLATVESFHKVRCPKCKAWARRETDVCDTFLDSSWYFLRYPAVKEKKKPWTAETAKKWFPVTSYIGGAEHAVLHLLYSRFLTMVFKDKGLVKSEEPFGRFRAHGLITKDGAKMSKSRGNVVNPDEYWKMYGTDVMRLYLAFMAPLDQGGDFRDAGIMGLQRFVDRIIRLSERVSKNSKTIYKPFDQAVHRAVKKVGEDIEALHHNTAVSALMILLNELETAPEKISAANWMIFLKLLAPFAPFVTEELWTLAGGKPSIHKAPWPKYDPKLIVADTFTLVIQVNGKIKDSVEAGVGISEDEARETALRSEKVRAALNGAEPKRIIYVPNRVVNIVI
jgi:leucyl-tRNA synthetase